MAVVLTLTFSDASFYRHVPHQPHNHRHGANLCRLQGIHHHHHFLFPKFDLTFLSRSFLLCTCAEPPTTVTLCSWLVSDFAWLSCISAAWATAKYSFQTKEIRKMFAKRRIDLEKIDNSIV
jgi:hypothetical protein